MQFIRSLDDAWGEGDSGIEEGFGNLFSKYMRGDMRRVEYVKRYESIGE